MKAVLATRLIIAASIMLAGGVAHAGDQKLSGFEQEVVTPSGTKIKLGTGVDYSIGKYGQSTDTEIVYVPVSAKVEKGNWTGKITIPWLQITGPSAVLGAGDSAITTGGSSTTQTTHSGLGDIITALTYDIPLTESFFLDLTGKVKIPTGDYDQGLGTGEADYTMQADVTKMYGAFAVFGAAGYKFVGKNSTLHLRDSVLFNGGFGYDVLPNLNAGAMYDWRLSASRGANPSEATLYLNYKPAKPFNVQVYGNMGFSDGSADHGFGLMLGYKF